MFGTKWKFNKNSVNSEGFTIVEIIVVIAIIVAAFIAILTFFIFENRANEKGEIRIRAVSLIEEAVEGVRNFRDNTDWTVDGVGALIPGTNYRLIMASKSWDMVPGSEVIDGFTRVVIFSNVSRDSNDNMEQIYNSLRNDPDTTKVSIIVTWIDRGALASESVETYITNWRR